MIKIKYALIFVAAALVVLLFAGCAQSQQEIDGINLLPQNRPASWENNMNMGIPLGGGGGGLSGGQ